MFGLINTTNKDYENACINAIDFVLYEPDKYIIHKWPES